MIFNVGITDVNYPVNKCPYYNKWRGMLKRCYSQKYLKKQPTYSGSSVYEEWKYLSNFKNWMETQDWKGKHLDKDILFPGNKIYSPETCVFVPSSLNSFMSNNSLKNTSGFNGVILDARTLKWTARISIENKMNHIGTYHSKEEAFYYYKIERNKEILKWIEKIEDNKIKEALKKHLYNLNDDTANFKGAIIKGKSHSKKCSIDGIVYDSVKEYFKTTNISLNTLYYRLKSESFPNYYYIKN